MGKMNKETKKAYLKKIDEVIKNGKYKDNWESLKNIEVPEGRPFPRLGTGL